MMLPKAIRGPEESGIASTALIRGLVDQINASYALSEAMPVDGGFNPVAIVKVMLDCEGGGKYQLSVFDPSRAQGFTVEDDLVEEDFGYLPPSPNAYGINPEEVGTDTHLLTEGGSNPLAHGIFRGFAENGWPIYSILSILSSPC